MSKGVRINSSFDYAFRELSSKSNDEVKLFLKDEFVVDNVPILLQRDYGKDNDCTITSIATLMSFLTKDDNYGVVYNSVTTNIKPKWAYGSYGTLPFCINKMLNNILKVLGLRNRKSHGRYFKGLGVTINTIKKWLKETKTPIILSLFKANDGYYNYHSVTVVGYYEYVDKYTGNNIVLLKIHDNWSKKTRYIDYKKIHWLCMFNYIK